MKPVEHLLNIKPNVTCSDCVTLPALNVFRFLSPNIFVVAF